MPKKAKTGKRDEATARLAALKTKWEWRRTDPNYAGGGDWLVEARRALADVRFSAPYGLKSDIAPCPKSAKSKLMHRNKKGDLFDHLSAHACAGSFGQPRLPKALNQ